MTMKQNFLELNEMKKYEMEDDIMMVRNTEKTMFIVNHLKDKKFPCILSSQYEALHWPTDYYPVAAVEIEPTGRIAEDLELVYEKCKSPEGSDFNWWNNSEVLWISPVQHGYRNLNVGDVIVLDPQNIYRVAPIGFDKIRLDARGSEFVLGESEEEIDWYVSDKYFEADPRD